MNILDRHQLTHVINARGTFTPLGVSRSSVAVGEAVSEALSRVQHTRCDDAPRRERRARGHAAVRGLRRRLRPVGARDRGMAQAHHHGTAQGLDASASAPSEASSTLVEGLLVQRSHTASVGHGRFVRFVARDHLGT